MKQWIQRLRSNESADHAVHSAVTTRVDVFDTPKPFEIIDIPLIQTSYQVSSGLASISSKMGGEFFCDHSITYPKNTMGLDLIPFIQLNLADLDSGLFGKASGLIQIFLDPLSYAQEEWNILAGRLDGEDPRLSCIYIPEPRVSQHISNSEFQALSPFQEEYLLSLVSSQLNFQALFEPEFEEHFTECSSEMVEEEIIWSMDNHVHSLIEADFEAESNSDDAEDHFLLKVNIPEMRKLGYPIQLMGEFQFFISPQAVKLGDFTQIQLKWIRD